MLRITNNRLRAINNQIETIKMKLIKIGLMRPGSLTKQVNRRLASGKTLEYWQLSYTHKMKSKTEYVRPEMLKKTKDQIKEFKQFKTLVEKWIELAIEQAKLTADEEKKRDKNS
jgi:hypothetical protein